jgi:hypothetical protein
MAAHALQFGGARITPIDLLERTPREMEQLVDWLKCRQMEGTEPRRVGLSAFGKPIYRVRAVGVAV